MDDFEGLTDEQLQEALDSVSEIAEPGGNAEVESLEEVGEVLRGMKERNKTEQERRAAATETEFWAQLVFQSRAQRDAFFAGLAASHLLEDQWVDGVALAAHLEIAIPESPKLSEKQPPKTWAALV